MNKIAAAAGYTTADTSLFLFMSLILHSVCRAVAEVVPGVLQDFRPDLVLYDAGVDPHHDDKLGRLSLTDSGLLRREMQVCSQLQLYI